ncbi:alpha/beta hydrolase [Kitasatospora sp. RB6PN24]|uniref:alpha/beta fold hydrolase n=1 Tax=Kitasatospora humi TaxID=2893891 RepID=UPI001E582D58|nr:alpha/beta hydrolase [Kitasatospora humi]MCC9310365.1 alpha/beta hydrolase [Kitasatospora humi]
MTEGGGGNAVGRAGLIGLGVLAAGAAAGVAIERLTLGRARRRAREELDAAAPFGSLRGRPRMVAAADGTELYVEVDEPEQALPGAPTVVFCHGYCLNQDSFHFQRAVLRGGLRLVFWDQRSHGRSERSRSYLGGRPATIDQLGSDLGAVLDAVVPTGPVVLVGHSMGGMTVMALAEQRPELFVDRVAAVALIGTTAGDWDSIDLGLSSTGMKVWRRLGPGVVRLLGSQVGLVEATRRAGADIAAVFYRRFSFGNGGKDVDPGIARFAEQLLDSTPIDVVAEFYPVFSAHDKAGALAALPPLPVLVLAGTDDLLTPASHSAAIARTLPEAELELLPGAGHLVLLESSDEVDRQLARLLCRTGLPLPARLRQLAADEG